MKIDSDGDGTFEEIKYPGQPGTGFSWVWVAVAGLSGLVGVLAGAFMVRRRTRKRQVAGNEVATPRGFATSDSIFFIQSSYDIWKKGPSSGLGLTATT